jgi:non-ribosomal peptide synthetase component F
VRTHGGVRNEVTGPGVVDGFFAAARAYPERAAITSNGRELTYAELEAMVLAVARRLGPRPGVVGVAATHSPDTIAGLFGVWAAGGAYCPIDPAFPAQRRQAMLAAAGCRTLLDADLDLDAPRDPVEDELAYILFTSGSTGEPKPVLTSRGAIAATIRSLPELFGLTPADRVLQFASLNWDTCFEEILPALTTGACLVFHDDAYTGSFPRFLRMIESEQITVLDLPTAYWHELVNYLLEEGAPLPECVRLVIIGGEAVNPARLADWCTLYTEHARLLNTYGCTETTLITHAVDLSGPLVMSPGAAWDSISRVPIGRPLPHVVEHITDTGELLIGGPSLATGYRGLPQATNARFVTVGQDRFFRTGDRVSRMPDGTLVHEGRIDHEIKIRGVRVDPAEVEAHIAGHPAVSAVVVTGIRVADHTALAAYIVPRQLVGTAGLDARIVDYLRDRVPAHLIPSRIRVVADLVYTASGKVDRHRLEETVT